MLQPSDEIKSKLDVVDIIRDYIPVKAAGINFRAKCPFHNEKTPSFMISPEKQIWHCFGCGKGGDIFAFVMEIEGVDFVGALKILAPKAGVVLTRQDPKITSEKNRALEILDLSRRYYHKVLLESNSAVNARNYLQKRGLTPDVIEEWQIGYSPDNWDAIYKFLRSKEFTDKEIFLAGMTVKSTNQPGYYDRFRGRIMFPVNDANGSTVAFTARVSPEKEATEKLGKYINSPQTIVYDKSKILFGFDKAKQAIKKHDAVIIVEGQMDTITAHQFGSQNAVASSGTALTSEQIILIKRLTTNVLLAFDMDAAGELAADRGVREAMAQETNIKILSLPAGKDPDECIRTDILLWQNAITSAKSIMEYYLEKATASYDVGKVEGKRGAAKMLLPIIAKIGNKIEQDFWIKQLSSKLDTREELLREAIAPVKEKKNKSEAYDVGTKVAINNVTREEKLSNLLIALLLKFSSLAEYAQKNIGAEYLCNEQNSELYKKILIYYNNVIVNDLTHDNKTDQAINYNHFREWLFSSGENYQDETDEGILPALDMLAILSDEEYYDFDFLQAKEQLIKLVVILKKNFLTNRMKEIGKGIEAAEKDKDNNRAQGLMHELKILGDELKDIKEDFL